MKRLVLTLAAGAFGSLMMLPIAHAQSWWDMNNDANAIRQDNAGIRHDRQELREDLEHGDFGAAARERERVGHLVSIERVKMGAALILLACLPGTIGVSLLVSSVVSRWSARHKTFA